MYEIQKFKNNKFSQMPWREFYLHEDYGAAINKLKSADISSPYNKFVLLKDNKVIGMMWHGKYTENRNILYYELYFKPNQKKFTWERVTSISV